MLEQRWLRVPLIAATVIATVATSQAVWSLSDRTAPKAMRIEPGQALDLNVDVDGSQGASLSVDLTKLQMPPGGVLRIESRDASRPECDDAHTLEDPPGGDAPFRFTPRCVPSGARSTVTTHFTNEGTAAVDFEVTVEATINGAGDDEPPEDAFIRVKVIE